jgi:hypothetical protein
LLSAARVTRRNRPNRPIEIDHTIPDPRLEVETCENSRVSPTVLRSGPYRFFFFASDRKEPIHVHVAREGKTAKFWLAPVRVAYNFGFPPSELNRIQGLVREHEAQLLKA